MIAYKAVLKRLTLLGLAAGLAAAVLGFGPNPQAVDPTLAEGKVSGRGLVGEVGPDRESGRDRGAVMAAVVTGDTARVVILTPRGEIAVLVDENTLISTPGGMEQVLERIAEGLPVRVAIVTDRPLLGDDGTPTGEPVTAQKLTIIPGKATREHRRVIVAENRGSGDVTIIDDNGKAIDSTGGAALDADGGLALGSHFASELPDQGEGAILLVRKGDQDGAAERVTGVVRAQRIVDRLSDLAGNTKLQDQDAFKSARLEGLLERHQSSLQERLENTLDKVEEKFREVIDRAVDRAKTEVRIRQNVTGAVSGLDADTAQCVRGILGRLPSSKNELGPRELQRVESECLGGDREGPRLRITSPEPGSTFNEGETVNIVVQAEDGDREVHLELKVNGEVRTPDRVSPTSAGLRITVTADSSKLTIQAKATDQDGNSYSATLVVDVRRDPPPRVRISSPRPEEVLAAGSTVTLEAQAQDNNEVVSIVFLVGEVRYRAALREQQPVSDIARRDAAPGRDERITAVANGSVQGVPVPPGVSSLSVEVVATDDRGNTAATSRTYKVTPSGSPRVWIAAPAEGASLIAGSTIRVSAQAQDDGTITSIEFLVNSTRHVPTELVPVELEAEDADAPGFDGRIAAVATGATTGVLVPAGVSLLTIQAIATDDTGLTATTSRTYRVARSESPRVWITSPAEGERLISGTDITVRAQAQTDGRIASIEFLVNGRYYLPNPLERQELDAETAAVPGFDGRIAGAVATGTTWAVPVPPGVSLLTIQAIATDNLGNTGTTTRIFRVEADPPPTVEIISPSDVAQVIAGSEITIDVKADDNGEVVSVDGLLTADGEQSYLVFEHLEGLEIPWMPWRVVGSIPVGASSISIEVTATDNLGNSSTAAYKQTVVSDPAPTVRIIAPVEGAEVGEGEAITIEVQADDNGEVSSVTGAVTDAGVRTTLAFGGWNPEYWPANPYTLLAGPTSFGEFISAVPPHVLTGTVTLDGTTAPDGTVVAAWIEGTGSGSTLLIEVTATDDQGNTATATREVAVRPGRIEVVNGTVSSGRYTLLVGLPPGENFSGREIIFIVNGAVANESVKWEQGGGIILDLTAELIGRPAS